uniref:DDE-1 domain-containing protein n=1 Tax=Spongospora subterranea TaxID=70186 RepID=A0A0H5RES6_9EUKA|eukprot:CRZ12231.1 hypothetical protein [Spongospora subterranea]
MWYSRGTTNPIETRELAADSVLSVKRQLAAFPNQAMILNMDQTPVFFSMQSRTTLERVGSRTVNIRSSTNSTLPVTVGVTVTADGNMLIPMIIFKGKTSGRIARTFGAFPEGALYACQDNAWMDEEMMLRWVEEVRRGHLYRLKKG